jgi:hypothetical protein
MPGSDCRFDGNYIHFLLEVDGVVAHCAVTYEYLVKCAEAHGLSFHDARAAFASLRPQIEALAARKFVAGSDRPLVISSDC